jgi:putative ABC transport system permease protein
VKLSVYLRYAARESRGSRGRLLFFTSCLAVGVAAVVAVGGLSASFEGGIRSEARRLLAAELVVKSRRPLPPELDEILATVPGALRTDVREMATVVAAPRRDDDRPRSQLVELKVVGPRYPFFGDLELRPDRPLADLLPEDGVVAAPEVLERLGLRIGDELRVGGAAFRITGEVGAEPDRIRVSFTLGPRVFLSHDGLERAGLIRFGSRVEYRALVRLDDGAGVDAVQALAARLREDLPDREYVTVETYADAQPALRDGLRRMQEYLGLVALLSLLIGGVGVAQVVRAWLAGRLDSIAVLKCLGVRARELMLLYLGQTAALGLLGSLVGAVVGLAFQLLLPLVLGDILPPGVEPSWWLPAPALRGILVGTGIAVLFSVPPLASLGRVPPARVIRRDAEPLHQGRTVRAAMWMVVLAGILVTAGAQSGSLTRGAWFTLGIVVTVAVLGVAAWGLSRAVGRFPSARGSVWLRHGIASVGRPGASTLGAIVALGVGVLVVLAMYLVQDRLSGQFEADLPEGAPTAFLVDIQPDQWDAIRSLLEETGAERIDSVPVVVGRLRTVEGRPVEELVEDSGGGGRRRWVFTREQRLTYMETLPEDNEIVDGALWSDPERAEVSIELDFARDLGVGVGSSLVFDVQGVPLELTVTSLRTVDWRTFGINFFLVVEPGVLEDAPQFRVAATRLPSGGEQRIQDHLVDRFPNVTVIRIREILEKVVNVIRRIGLGVRLLGGFTVLAGIVILMGAIGADAVRRGREVALLKTLGMTRWGVAAMFSVEYALVGLVAGVIGSIGAGVLAWAVLDQGMQIRFDPNPVIFPVAVGGSVLLTVLAGTAAGARALARRPVEVLRDQ